MPVNKQISSVIKKSLSKIETVYMFISDLTGEFFESLQKVESLENVFGLFEYKNYCEAHRKYRDELKKN